MPFKFKKLYKKFKIIDQRIGEEGYVELRIKRKSGTKKWIKRYRLVAELYIEKIPISCDIHHKDFDKLNDRPSNLEIITKAEHLEKHNVGCFNDGALIPGNNPRNTGQKHSRSTKRQMSLMAMGNKNSDESCRFITNPEWGQKISKSMQGNQNRTGRKDVTKERVLKLYEKGMSFREVSRRLGCSLTCVLSRLERRV